MVTAFGDVSLAHFHPLATREIRFKLPKEDPRSDDPILIGRALKSMYGANGVGVNFEVFIERLLL